jgi:hypothetical protein
MCLDYIVGALLNDSDKNKQLINKIMTQITELQYDDLVHRIYETLMSNEDFGLGEMGSCRDEAKRIVIEWCKENQINIPLND